STLSSNSWIDLAFQVRVRKEARKSLICRIFLDQ
uniref:Kinesin-like protein n=1 Tax=Parascaris univalens TaxID=6257 RepID=A0A914ZTF2_PARUN